MNAGARPPAKPIQDDRTQYGFKMRTAVLDRLRVHCMTTDTLIGQFIEDAVVRALDLPSKADS